VIWARAAARGPQPPHSTPNPRLRPPTHLRWPPPKPWGQRAGGAGRSEDSESSPPRGRGRGISPHACPGLLPSPSPARWGAHWGNSTALRRLEDSGKPGLGSRQEKGGRRGAGWDQGRSCLPPQTPAAPACPGLSVHGSRLSRGLRGQGVALSPSSQQCRDQGKEEREDQEKLCV
jgi:hypothetical protein